MTDVTHDPTDEWDDQPESEVDLIAVESAKSPYPLPGELGAPTDLPNDWTPEDMGAPENGR